MPCLLKTMHDSSYYTASSLRTRSAAQDNPGIVVSSPKDAAVIALMVLFFGLLGTAIVLVAVFYSKRSLDKECGRARSIQLRRLPSPSKAESNPLTSSKRSTTSSTVSGKPDSPPGTRCQTIRSRRGLPDLSVICQSELPQVPPPTHQSQPRAVSPGVRYGMGQMGNDGKIHRPESIFEHLRP